ncbi:FAD-dependent oxidoreductase [Tessaracoccus flavus]|nr:FAD-dependent oxidoreductase [Tessaracoccus flavus]SDZ12961.1 NADPH-dependent 2,4-dienoyl-CoA reductase, sulfur reductase [Tessaracoccus flavus]
MRIVIVGGVAGGMSAATRLRRLDESAEITVVERSGYVSFANCGLPYHVGGVIEKRSALLLQTPESLYERFRIDVRVGTEAVSIDREAKQVTVRDVETREESVLPYDKLILSPGAKPVLPPIPGIERALPLRNIEDTDAMVAAIENSKTAVVIGGGFIGLEVAENLLHLGMKVTLVEAMDQVMAPLDPEMVAPVHRRLRSGGIDLRLGSGVTAIGERDVTLADGSSVPADVVVASIGVRPEVGLAREAGLKIGERGGITVDERQLTSDPSIYAVGDAVEKSDALGESPILVPLANTANLQGRRVADDIAGRGRPARGVMGTAIVGVLGLQVAVVGMNEKRLRSAGRPYRAIHTHPGSHAGYYPGATTMALKLLVDPETDEILGAQGVGEDGVDKRIDVIATAMAGGLKASDLAELELAYAPPFGSAKDAVNMLGFVAENRATGWEKCKQWHEVAEAQNDGWTVVDVRTPREFEAGAIPGAINIPVDELRERLGELPDGPLLLHCGVGIRSHVAYSALKESGRQIANLDGGYTTWWAGTHFAS